MLKSLLISYMPCVNGKELKISININIAKQVKRHSEIVLASVYLVKSHLTDLLTRGFKLQYAAKLNR